MNYTFLCIVCNIFIAIQQSWEKTKQQFDGGSNPQNHLLGTPSAGVFDWCKLYSNLKHRGYRLFIRHLRREPGVFKIQGTMLLNCCYNTPRFFEMKRLRVAFCFEYFIMRCNTRSIVLFTRCIKIYWIFFILFFLFYSYQLKLSVCFPSEHRLTPTLAHTKTYKSV